MTVPCSLTAGRTLSRRVRRFPRSNPRSNPHKRPRADLRLAPAPRVAASLSTGLARDHRQQGTVSFVDVGHIDWRLCCYCNACNWRRRAPLNRRAAFGHGFKPAGAFARPAVAGVAQQAGGHSLHARGRCGYYRGNNGCPLCRRNGAGRYRLFMAQTTGTPCRGQQSEYAAIKTSVPVTGRFFNQQEVQQRARGCHRRNTGAPAFSRA